MDAIVLNNSFLECDSEIHYFKEITVSGHIYSQNCNENFSDIVGSAIDIKIINTEVFSGEMLVSNEGQVLSGCTLMIEYSVRNNIKYITGKSASVLFLTSLEDGNYCYVVVPTTINNISIERIINSKNYTISYFIENVENAIINSTTIHYSISILFVFFPIYSYNV
ncbi:MAG: hypothetical protein ACRC68_12390 [Clostridium sp.]